LFPQCLSIPDLKTKKSGFDGGGKRKQCFWVKMIGLTAERRQLGLIIYIRQRIFFSFSG
jgi:hypothetical protein